MSVAVDVDKSAKCRADGNASFKKGKWAESIGHYTNASLFNPSDPAPLCNRAQCYLNLEKWNDAERDCTTVLGLQNDHVKALFRRGVARKELGRMKEAVEDFKKVASLDPQNAAVKAELEECVRKEMARPKPRKSPAPSQPAQQPTASASIIEINDEAPQPARTTVPATTFANARQTRDTKRSFVAPKSSTPPPPPVPVQTSSKPSEKTEPTIGEATSRTPPSPPRDPDSLSAGSGIAFVRKIEECESDAERWSILSLYKPYNLPKLLPSLLEPEMLASLLTALDYASSDHEDLVKSFLTNIPQVQGFKTSAVMLLASEKKAGQTAWTKAGGEGSWL